jgi:hypothetical protein
LKRTKEELIFIEEVAARFAEGKTLEKIYQELNWPYEKVKKYANTLEFEEYLKREAPSRLDAWLDSKSSAASERLKDIAKANKHIYLDALDKLARNATNENVRYNAIIAMLKYSGEDNEAMQPVEIVEMPDYLMEDIWRRKLEVERSWEKNGGIPTKIPN